MRFKRMTRIAAAVAVIGAVAAGGAAFTADSGQPSGSALGYGTTSVTGGTINGITYQLSADGTTINTATITTTADLLTAGYNGTSAKVYLAWNGDGFGSGGDATCVIQTGGQTTICTPNGGSGEAVTAVSSVQIAITNANDTFATH
jgi:hypothetical protein